ncbi:protein XRI1-like isoform X2 [Nymphaea colorata]|uniref:protein XRI1-like isoform X2 n=1 Tax=Nymphaea colorata TaxID=210225 RepID=UPI00214E4F42|nr:protein XRI1-like isoform X2 [Nymphaea colorata]
MCPNGSDWCCMMILRPNNEPWEWQDDIRFQSDSPLDISHCLWDELEQGAKNSWCVFDETTPIKDYAGSDYPVSFVTDQEVTDKGMEEYRSSSSQLKRRRMLQFSPEMTVCTSDEKKSSALFKSKVREDPLTGVSADLYFSGSVPEGQIWASRLPGCRSGSEYLDQSPDGWLVECFNDQDMQISSDDINFSGISEEQIDVSEFCTMPPQTEMNAWQSTDSTPQALSTYFSGTPSSTETPNKPSAPVAYPFTLIKPCGMQGAVTLSDINQRILTPPASMSKYKKSKDAASSYPTSAFSGKPVVALTKIQTEGGKGSITIMRTKG